MLHSLRFIHPLKPAIANPILATKPYKDPENTEKYVGPYYVLGRVLAPSLVRPIFSFDSVSPTTSSLLQLGPSWLSYYDIVLGRVLAPSR